MADLRMEFKPATLLPGQQPQITQFCREVRRNNWSQLGSSTTAIVYSWGLFLHKLHFDLVASCLSRYRSQWWHANTHDPRLHVTVRYDRRVPATRRVHIYQDGTANLYPHTGLRARLMKTTALADEEGSDGSVEFSDQEDQESPEAAGN